MENDRTDKQNVLNEIRKFVKKTLQENSFNNSFSNSKVVDKNVKPLVSYHGTWWGQTTTHV